MISAKNYAAQAERDFLNYSKEISDKIRSNLYARFATAINSAVHFAMPDNGQIFDDQLKGLVGQDLHLPYKQITIEFATTDSYIGDAQSNSLMTVIPSTKSLILASEYEGEGLVNFRKAVTERPYLEGFVKTGEYDWFYTTDRFIHVVSFTSGKNLHWSPNPLGVVINGYWTNDGGVRVTYLPTEGMVLQAAISNNLLEPIALSAHTAVRELLEFLEALTCKNVKESVHQSERKNNAKWVKLGKLPMYETRILTIDTAEKQFTQTGSGENSGRTHSSPRQHLRRGHIRRLESGNVWVNSCVVGSSANGVLDKTYKVK
jgi:hypothetical protein